MLDFCATEGGESLLKMLVSTFVKEGMREWMGSLEGVNAWEEFMEAVTKPGRGPAVNSLTRIFVNEAILTYLHRHFLWAVFVRCPALAWALGNNDLYKSAGEDRATRNILSAHCRPARLVRSSPIPPP